MCQTVEPKSTREMEMETFITHRSSRKEPACLKGAAGWGSRPRESKQRARPGLGHVPL